MLGTNFTYSSAAQSVPPSESRKRKASLPDDDLVQQEISAIYHDFCNEEPAFKQWRDANGIEEYFSTEKYIVPGDFIAQVYRAFKFSSAANLCFHEPLPQEEDLDFIDDSSLEEETVRQDTFRPIVALFNKPKPSKRIAPELYVPDLGFRAQEFREDSRREDCLFSLQRAEEMALFPSVTLPNLAEVRQHLDDFENTPDSIGSSIMRDVIDLTNE